MGSELGYLKLWFLIAAVSRLVNTRGVTFSFFPPVFSTLSWSFPKSGWLVWSCYLCCQTDLHWKVLDSWVRSTHWSLYCILEELIVKAAVIYSFGGANTTLSVYWPAKTDRWLCALSLFQSQCKSALAPRILTDVENASLAQAGERRWFLGY